MPALPVLLRFQAVGFEFAVEVGAFQADFFGQQADVAPAFLQFAPQELFLKQGPGLPKGRHLEERVDEFAFAALFRGQALGGERQVGHLDGRSRR